MFILFIVQSYYLIISFIISFLSFLSLNSNVSIGYSALNILQNSPDAITQISYDSGINCLSPVSTESDIFLIYSKTKPK